MFQTTRLGRDINELRRKTKNEFLAKRAKELVRRWRDLILPHSEPAPITTDVSQQNGANRNVKSAIARAHPISPAASLPNSDKSSVSPVLSSRVEAVPKTHAANKRLRKGISPPSSLVDSKRTVIESSPELPSVKRAKTESQKSSETQLNGDHYDSVGSDCEIVSVTPAQPKQKNSKKAPKDRTIKESLGDDIVKEKIASIARIPKVKTTQELLAGLKARTNDPTTNCAGSVVDHDIARNKTEHIARFLRSQSDELEVIDVESQDNENGSGTTTETAAPVQSTAAVKQEPTIRTAEEILTRLPPLDVNSIKWDETPVSSPEPHEVTSEEIDRVLNDHIEGINGNYDERGESENKVFREWHEVVSRTSYNSELIHILPYVVID